jgi:NAD(P)-dependent dehydrogenase (short-subunit alcohol dehydrogenase family)
VLVTGGSSGIGLATARYLAVRGVPVYATVRNEADADRLNELDGIDALVCDVRNDAQVTRLGETISERGAGVWGLVNNAGVAHVGPLTKVPMERMLDVFDVNVFGVHRVTNAVVESIVASGGRIVNVSSIHGTLSGGEGGVYAMSKHALEAYTDALALQLRDVGVHVCAVAPGNFDSALVTNFIKNVPLSDGASEWVRELYEPGAVTARPQFPPPDAVAEACFHALFDPAPLRRYLITPNEREAHLTLKKAALELAHLNRYTAYRLSPAALHALIDEVVEMAAAPALPPRDVQASTGDA